ncbi:SAM-dependent methyltransferase [Streptomyces spirodelae]|uniref:SAM-dependent methyltransferase n=1 Tax=Streptomyces spirodelae TaxID=2812904 RepID=A0ABS3X0R8_9ACTN|nr:SAM-dependent methyltransferase [Streptomyces spirodelae]MBO8188981.1 SAM-dependent methyltransferase [Streptomyces spirodelae]
MTPTLVHHQHPTRLPGADSAARVRDWAEIQERMLVPLYEAVYERMETGPGSRVLGLGCGTGLALLLAADRGAGVHGADTDTARLELAGQRLLGPAGAGQDGPTGAGQDGPADDSQDGPGSPDREARLTYGTALEAVAAGARPTLVTAFGTLPGQEELVRLREKLGRGVAVVLAGWGPMERCAVAPALRVAARLAEPAEAGPDWCGRDDLEELAAGGGLRLEGSGRVACPFGYADMAAAVRGLLSTGLYDSAVRATDEEQVLKELVEALHPHLRADGTVWMPNLFRYVVART